MLDDHIVQNISLDERDNKLIEVAYWITCAKGYY